MFTAVTENPTAIDCVSKDILRRKQSLAVSALAHSNFALVSEKSEKRQYCEKYIADRFERAFGAQITEFFPTLLVCEDRDAIKATVGLRSGEQRPFFLEQYLEDSLEKIFGTITGNSIQRSELIEIGNLAASGKPCSQALFVLLAAILAEAGYKWVVFTATAQIRCLLEGLQLQAITLCAASESKLTPNAADWGSYYAARPEVQAGSLATAMQVLGRNHLANSILLRYADTITQLARLLREGGKAS